MKAHHLTYTVLAATIGLMAACSNVDEGDRLIFVETIDSLLSSHDSTQVVKHVLIEDFTGQACVNCPAATALIYDLQNTYGEENIIAVGLYSGPFGQTVSGRLYSLTTETGNYYYDFYNVDGQPSAMINRHSPNSVTATWATEVYNAIQEEGTVDLHITNVYDAATRTASISVEGTATQTINGKIQVWLIENSITDFQYLDDGSIDDNYVHNHVFRTTVNDRDGDAYALADGAALTTQYTYTLDEEWVAENVAVVAIVSDDSGIRQVEKASLIPQEQINNE